MSHGRRHAPLIEQFWRYLVPGESDDCWKWRGYRKPEGYGRLIRLGKSYYAHRVAHELYNGPIPEGHQVMHSCDNRACCNPKHISTGTNRENALDAARKGRIGKHISRQRRGPDGKLRKGWL